MVFVDHHLKYITFDLLRHSHPPFLEMAAAKTNDPISHVLRHLPQSFCCQHTGMRTADLSVAAISIFVAAVKMLFECRLRNPVSLSDGI